MTAKLQPGKKTTTRVVTDTLLIPSLNQPYPIARIAAGPVCAMLEHMSLEVTSTLLLWLH